MNRPRPSSSKSRKKSLAEQIAETEKLDPHERVSVQLRILRSLYQHGLYAQRDGDYGSFSGLVEELLRRDKQMNPRPTTAQSEGSEDPPLSAEDRRKIKRIAHDLMMGKKITRADWDLPEP